MIELIILASVQVAVWGYIIVYRYIQTRRTRPNTNRTRQMQTNVTEYLPMYTLKDDPPVYDSPPAYTEIV